MIESTSFRYKLYRPEGDQILSLLFPSDQALLACQRENRTFIKGVGRDQQRWEKGEEVFLELWRQAAPVGLTAKEAKRIYARVTRIEVTKIVRAGANFEIEFSTYFGESKVVLACPEYEALEAATKKFIVSSDFGGVRQLYFDYSPAIPLWASIAAPGQPEISVEFKAPILQALQNHIQELSEDPNPQ